MCYIQQVRVARVDPNALERLEVNPLHLISAHWLRYFLNHSSTDVLLRHADEGHRKRRIETNYKLPTTNCYVRVQYFFTSVTPVESLKRASSRAASMPINTMPRS